MRKALCKVPAEARYPIAVMLVFSALIVGVLLVDMPVWLCALWGGITGYVAAFLGNGWVALDEQEEADA